MVLLSLTGNKTFSQSDVFIDGEELYYEVYYSFIDIGWVEFHTKKLDADRYICSAEIRSKEGLPFVTLSYDFTSVIQIADNNIRPLRFESVETNEGRKSVLSYYFNYDSSYVYIKKIGPDNNIEYEKNMPIYSVYQDGLSIFYYARYNFSRDYRADIPVLFNQDSTSIEIDFNTAKQEEDISAVDYSVSSMLLEGSTNYQLVFGLTGNFSGWFSKDAARVPVKAKLKVKIGNVTLELRSWKRANWSPPKY